MVVRALIILLVVVSACAYPRRSTSLSPVGNPGNVNAPPDIMRIRIAGAVIPPNQRGGSPWDEDGSGPDSFVRIYRGETLLFESDVVEDQLEPEFAVETGNLRITTDAQMRIELWERDSARLPTPIGTWNGRGLPRGALRDADASLMLEGRATLLFRVLAPTVERGTGIALYEFRSEHVKVIEVIAASPAGRAGLQEGDEIIAVDGQSIDDLDEGGAASALSMASSRTSRFTVRRGTSNRDVELDEGYTWRAL